MENLKGMKVVGSASLVLAVLQSICTAVLTISGVRLALGLTAFVMAGSLRAPVNFFHQDAIRIPMLALATVGALVDLAVLAWMWRLRTQSSALWRRRARSAKEKRSERLQVALAVLTLVLVVTETWTHIVLHRPHVHVAAQATTARQG